MVVLCVSQYKPINTPTALTEQRVCVYVSVCDCVYMSVQARGEVVCLSWAMEGAAGGLEAGLICDCSSALMIVLIC